MIKQLPEALTNYINGGKPIKCYDRDKKELYAGDFTWLDMPAFERRESKVLIGMCCTICRQYVYRVVTLDSCSVSWGGISINGSC